MKKLLLALFSLAAVTLFAIPETPQAQSVPPAEKRREFAKKLAGKIRFVEKGEGIRVKFVAYGEDLRVRFYFPNTVPRRPGSWAVCESWEDVRVRVVQSGEQVRVRVVDVHEGLPGWVDRQRVGALIQSCKGAFPLPAPLNLKRVDASQRKKLARSIFGQIEFVEYGEDARVRFVERDQDLRVRFRPPNITGSYPGAWTLGQPGKFRLKIVEYGEDFTASVVDSGFLLGI